MLSVLRFLYTGAVEQAEDLEELLGLLNAADALGIDSLRRHCEVHTRLVVWAKSACAGATCRVCG